MVTTLGEEREISAYRDSSIKHPLSNKPPPSDKSLLPFQGKNVNKTPLAIKPPFPHLNILHL